MFETNAVITSVSITNDDHGLLSAWLMLDYGGSGQGFGGYALYLPNSFIHHKDGGAYCGHFIWRCMEIGNVSEWSQLVGKTIRVRKEKDSWGAIKAIGHIIKDDWFDVSAEFEQIERDRMNIHSEE